MDYYTILAQKYILDRKLTGLRFDTVRVRDKYNLFLGFEGEQALKLSCKPDMPYLFSMEKRYIPVKKAQDWFMPRFKGQKLAGLSITPGDRILTFHLKSGARLIFEMTGRNANIILVDNKGLIAGAIRTITTKESGIREIRPGVPYAPPPARDFSDLVWSPLPALERLLLSGGGSVVDSLTGSLCAGSRLFAFEACALAGVEPDTRTGDLNPADSRALFKSMASLVAEIEQGGSGATLLSRKDGLPYNVFPVRMKSNNISGDHADNLDEAVKKYARVREIELERRSLKTFIAGALKRKERSLKSTIRKVEQEHGDDSEPELLEHKGNTVLANLHRIKKGVDSIKLPDPYGSGEVEIKLDPKLNGPRNAERFFTRARKLRSASGMAEGRLSSLRKRLETIAIEYEKITGLDEIKELKAIASQYMRIQASGQAADFDEKFPRRFKSVSGLDIIVGRNDRENDELIRWAHKNDFWLHAQNVGGSHVILRSPGKQSPDHKSIEQAAAIAAYYSKAKTSAIVPVACTQVKYVVKRRGQGPGKVTYTREKVIFAEPGIPGK